MLPYQRNLNRSKRRQIRRNMKVSEILHRTCDNCRFFKKGPFDAPCSYCEGYSNWTSLYSKASESEPKPTGNGQTVLYLVLKDLIDRAEVGKKEYGTYLKTNNGRSALTDAYEEALDLCMYLKQALLESQK